MPRKLTSVEITNVKAIEHLKIDCGQVVVVSGRNGAGKSSLLDAISQPFDGGHSPELIRHGAEKARVLLTLDDGVTIEKIISAKDSSLVVKSPDGGLVKAPKSFVERLAASFSYDPLALMRAPAKDRAKFLLENMPINFGRDEVNEAIGVVRIHEPISLERLNGLIDGVREQRKEVNRKHRDREGMVRQQQQAVGSDDADVDWKARAQHLQNEISTVRDEVAKAKGDMDAQAERLKATARERTQKQVDELKEKLAAELKSIDAEAKRIYDEGTAEAQVDLERLAGELATASAKADEAIRSQAGRANLDKLKKEVKDLFFEAESMGEQIKRLEALKERKLKAEMPIPDLDIRGGEVYLDNVPWDQVNTSEQMLVACQIAAQGQRELGIVVLDEAEHLDGDRFEQFLEAAKQCGLQVITARVSEDPKLTVEAA